MKSLIIALLTIGFGMNAFAKEAKPLKCFVDIVHRDGSYAYSDILGVGSVEQGKFMYGNRCAYYGFPTCERVNGEGRVTFTNIMGGPLAQSVNLGHDVDPQFPGIQNVSNLTLCN